MNKTMNTIMDAIKGKFPLVPILSTIGNNDVLYHYQAPNATDKIYYYNDLYNMWFKNVGANSNSLNSISNIETTFK